MTALPVRSLAALRPLRWLAPALLLVSVASEALAEEPIAVALDEARIMKLPERAATVVIGNPLIADISIQAGNLGVITGKAYGATNIIVLDHGGAVLTELTIDVKGPRDSTVVVYRGATRETYSCTPLCSPRITLGDDNTFFTQAINEATTRNTQALAAGAASGH